MSNPKRLNFLSGKLISICLVGHHDSVWNIIIGVWNIIFDSVSETSFFVFLSFEAFCLLGHHDSVWNIMIGSVSETCFVVFLKF